VEAHPIGQVWGGYRLYDDSRADEIYAALHDFVLSGPNDTKAAIIVSSIVATADTPVQLVYFFYDGPEPPTTGPFADLLAVPSLVSLTSKQSYSSLVRRASAL
jgi:hypothetical protein